MKAWNYTTGEMIKEINITFNIIDFSISEDFLILLTQEGYIIKYDIANWKTIGFIGYVTNPLTILKAGNEKVLTIEDEDNKTKQSLKIWNTDKVLTINLK